MKIFCRILLILCSCLFFFSILLITTEIIFYKNLYKAFKPISEIPELLKIQEPVYSEAIVFFNSETKDISFAKNPYTLFPPASLTKLVTLAIIYEALLANRITEDTIVPISENAWAKNLPKDSSLMFLEPMQKVTIREIIMGLSIPSGNDAAIAIAEFLSGSVDNFVKEMNKLVKKLGLKQTYFEDSIGYSPFTYTTALDFAKFSDYYIHTYEKYIKENNIHLAKSFLFPTPKNYPKGQWKGKHTIYNKNHNPLIGKIEGLEGLKTGYIGKSGFNVSISVKRDNLRFIAVQLGSFAGTANSANNNRIDDLVKITEKLYSQYKLITLPTEKKIYYHYKNPQYHYADIIDSRVDFFSYISRYDLKQNPSTPIGFITLYDSLGNKARYPIIYNEGMNIHFPLKLSYIQLKWKYYSDILKYIGKII